MYAFAVDVAVVVAVAAAVAVAVAVAIIVPYRVIDSVRSLVAVIN